MKDTNNTLEQMFFELLQVAIGRIVCLSHSPSAEEWKGLYEMAKKQSLVGVCFAGVQKLVGQQQAPEEMLYLTWMGMAAKIQQRNEVVNQQCAELQSKLSADGLRSCVLKGQGNATLYRVYENDNDNENRDLSLLRQSGDIDVWVDASRKEIIEHVQKVAPTTNVREHHLEMEAFQDTEVEVHYWPAVIRHFRKNARLQKWFDSKREEQFCHNVKVGGQDVCVPTPEFNAVQQMAHMYHHLFDGGVGLRQVMDYYFVLQALSSKVSDGFMSVSNAIEHIGMGRFASAMMYVLHEVMGLEESRMIVAPNEEDGRFLLEEIMRGGNFGKYDDKQTRDSSHYLSSFLGGVTWNLRFLRFNPFDWFWSPLWRIYYFCWRKAHGYH